MKQTTIGDILEARNKLIETYRETYGFEPKMAIYMNKTTFEMLGLTGFTKGRKNELFDMEIIDNELLNDREICIRAKTDFERAGEIYVKKLKKPKGEMK